MQTLPTPFLATVDSLNTFDVLAAASRRTSMEVDTALPLTESVDTWVPPKRKEQSWIYGTAYWDMLTPAQQHELLRLEHARDIASLIRVKSFLPVVHLSLVNKYREALPKAIVDCLMLSSKEGLVHALAFKRYMKLAKLPQVQTQESPFMQFVAVASEAPPVFTVLLLLLVSWATELNTMFCMQQDSVPATVQQLFRQHQTESARHIAFCRRLVEDQLAHAGAGEIAAFRAQLAPLAGLVIDEITFNPVIGNFTSFAFPVSPEDAAAIAEIRSSSNNRALNQARFKEMNDWLTGLGLA